MRVQTAWREARDRELDSADQVMVDRYGNAITLARRYNVSNPAVVRAIAAPGVLHGRDRRSEAGSNTRRACRASSYSPGMFLRIRPGLVTAPTPEGMAPPRRRGSNVEDGRIDRVREAGSRAASPRCSALLLARRQCAEDGARRGHARGEPATCQAGRRGGRGR